MKLSTNPENFVKSPKRYALARRLHSEIWVKFAFWGPILPLAPMGGKHLAWKSRPKVLHTKFHPIGVTCRRVAPAQRQTSKSPPE